MSRKKGSKIEVFNGFIKQVPRAMFYLISGYEKVKIDYLKAIHVNSFHCCFLVSCINVYLTVTAK